jgi:hypothetical protein
MLFVLFYCKLQYLQSIFLPRENSIWSTLAEMAQVRSFAGKSHIVVSVLLYDNAQTEI